jgi:hypothetical protein
MIQDVLIISSSGLVVFNKQFTQRGIERIFGALLRSILELSVATTGMALSYIEMATVAISISTHPDVPVYCALFFDRDTRKEVAIEFGRTLGARILGSFVDEYGGDLEGAVGLNVSHFKPFGFRILPIVRDVARGVLQQCT